MKLKKEDNIIVTAGKDKGRKGKIQKIFPKAQRVLVTGINIYKAHRKPRSEKQKGGIIEISRPLPVANVALICPKCGKQTRVGYRVDKEGEKFRFCKKCQALI